MRILIVEDDTETRAFVAQGLTQAGHQVAVSVVAATGCSKPPAASSRRSWSIGCCPGWMGSQW